jgi:phosphate starvation-inducible PhoH-like protein
LIEKRIELRDPAQALILFGQHDSNLRTLREALGVKVVARDTTLKISGETESVRRACDAVSEILAAIETGAVVSASVAGELLASKILGVKQKKSGDALDDYLLVSLRTKGQERYVRSILEHTVVFCIGPAGTGKTYLAVMMAVSFLKKGIVDKIVLVRPAVEAGEKLGFLPGDFQAKISPYLRPIYDALYDLLDVEAVRRYKEKDIIEIIPLAYMRGRTLNNSFIILDEAQNTTSVQMKMFLTRLGIDSKAVVTGDITQIDLPRHKSGLVRVQKILKGIKGVDFVYMTNEDIIRHPIIQKILEAYEGEKE